ncbi:T9SS type A sorting domain-containing protein [Flavobacterium luminosum]
MNAGVYLVRVEGENGVVSSRKLIKE